MNQGEDLDCGAAGLTSLLVGEHGAEDAGIGWLRKQVVALEGVTDLRAASFGVNVLSQAVPVRCV